MWDGFMFCRWCMEIWPRRDTRGFPFIIACLSNGVVLYHLVSFFPTPHHPLHPLVHRTYCLPFGGAAVVMLFFVCWAHRCGPFCAFLWISSVWGWFFRFLLNVKNAITPVFLCLFVCGQILVCEVQFSFHVLPIFHSVYIQSGRAVGRERKYKKSANNKTQHPYSITPLPTDGNGSKQHTPGRAYAWDNKKQMQSAYPSRVESRIAERKDINLNEALRPPYALTRMAVLRWFCFVWFFFSFFRHKPFTRCTHIR